MMHACIQDKQYTTDITFETHLALVKSTSLGTSISIGIDPYIFGKNLVIRKGKSIVSRNHGRIQRRVSRLLFQNSLRSKQGRCRMTTARRRSSWTKGRGARSGRKKSNSRGKLHGGRHLGNLCGKLCDQSEVSKTFRLSKLSTSLFFFPQFLEPPLFGHPSMLKCVMLTRGHLIRLFAHDVMLHHRLPPTLKSHFHHDERRQSS